MAPRQTSSTKLLILLAAAALPTALSVVMLRPFLVPLAHEFQTSVAFVGHPRSAGARQHMSGRCGGGVIDHDPGVDAMPRGEVGGPLYALGEGLDLKQITFADMYPDQVLCGDAALYVDRIALLREELGDHTLLGLYGLGRTQPAGLARLHPRPPWVPVLCRS
jgi:hypothetical protein